MNIDKILPSNLFRRDLTNFSDQAFIDDISNQEWYINNSQGTNAKFDNFLSRIDKCVDLHAPIKKLNRKQIKKISKPWINNYIIKMIAHRDRLFKRKPSE